MFWKPNLKWFTSSTKYFITQDKRLAVLETKVSNLEKSDENKMYLERDTNARIRLVEKHLIKKGLNKK